MQFRTIKTATLGVFAVAVLGTTALSGPANARPVDGYSSDWNWNANGWGRDYGQMNGWNSDWNSNSKSYQPRQSRKAHLRERQSRQHASRHHRHYEMEAYGAARDNRYRDTQAQYATQIEQSGRRSRSRRVNADGASATGYGGGDLVSEARRYIGGNPTGRSSLWCGAFMDLILRRTGHRPGSNLARDYANYGTRVSGPQVGAIAVMGRRGGGHVGVVSGIDASGNPIIISGNHGHRVAEATYSRGRVYAYVMP